jgi:hypothetical protein
MPCHGNGQTNPAVIELFGNVDCGSVCGAAIDDAGEQPRRAYSIAGVAHGPSAYREADGDRRRCLGLFTEEDRPVLQLGAGGGQTLRNSQL